MLMPGPRPTIVLVHGATITEAGAPEIRPSGSGSYVVLTLQGFREHFGQDLASDETIVLHATQGPFAQAANDEKITHAAWRDKPSRFVLGENDRMLLPELEKATARKLGSGG